MVDEPSGQAREISDTALAMSTDVAMAKGSDTDGSDLFSGYGVIEVMARGAEVVAILLVADAQLGRRSEITRLKKGLRKAQLVMTKGLWLPVVRGLDLGFMQGHRNLTVPEPSTVVLNTNGAGIVGSVEGGLGYGVASAVVGVTGCCVSYDRISHVEAGVVQHCMWELHYMWVQEASGLPESLAYDSSDRFGREMECPWMEGRHRTDPGCNLGSPNEETIPRVEVTLEPLVGVGVEEPGSFEAAVAKKGSGVTNQASRNAGVPVGGMQGYPIQWFGVRASTSVTTVEKPRGDDQQSFPKVVVELRNSGKQVAEVE
ncbi:hypothetical protein NE237_030773 [Protea cynaroides]|uniref:Uncharacterized protein n=1 Tax=Protea cynaroides TaxID=273540 RepID=A0A9Q0JW43_9MAGN|nr:hypothetical protein NE237_030773 [Protea cynaroides]